ncbi:hypothetical protein Rsub_07811 [Raphidocelis subcapitata]|uniref:Dynamin stalk domain-containing protein n=1 Tax=Raphidocelis subcapitata TaxID=307507 RepID=A0A2V0PBV6_9CHLO|nr:hypothetical protein Rsub_07811 [Raphidocelis subcapitata]|eukprot:GBF95383.1 hypothetical protein Rsub_07811 [Raphidocelis subcapitata]
MQPALSTESALELQRLVAGLLNGLHDAMEGDRLKLMQSNNKVLKEFAGRIVVSRPFFYRKGEQITLADIKRIAEENRVRELPGFLPYRTLDTLIEEEKGRWDLLIDDAADAVAANLEEVLLESVDEFFGRFPAAAVAIRSRLLDVFNSTFDRAKEQLTYLKLMESGCTLTYNEHYLLAARESFSTALRSRYYGVTTVGQAATEHVNAAISALARLGLTGVQREDLFKLVKDDDGVAPFLNMAAATLACHQPAPGSLPLLKPTLHWPPRLPTHCPPGDLQNQQSTRGEGGGSDAATGAGGTPADELLREERHTATRRAGLEAQRRMLRDAQHILNST